MKETEKIKFRMYESTPMSLQKDFPEVYNSLPLTCEGWEVKESSSLPSSLETGAEYCVSVCTSQDLVWKTILYFKNEAACWLVARLYSNSMNFVVQSSSIFLSKEEWEASTLGDFYDKIKDGWVSNRLYNHYNPLALSRVHLGD